MFDQVLNTPKTSSKTFYFKAFSRFLTYTYFSYLLHDYPTASFGPLSRGQPHQSDVYHCMILCFDPEVKGSVVTRVGPMLGWAKQDLNRDLPDLNILPNSWPIFPETDCVGRGSNFSKKFIEIHHVVQKIWRFS